MSLIEFVNNKCYNSNCKVSGLDMFCEILVQYIICKERNTYNINLKSFKRNFASALQIH